jgi:hypothetical protein
MKKFTKLMLMVAAVMFVATGCQKIEEDIDVSLKSSGEVTIINNWKSGNAAFECKAAGGECGYAYKIDEWDEYFGMDGAFETIEGNTITILNSDGKTFDWMSEYPVCKVIVKAGRGAIIYSYPEGVMHDEGLVGFQGKGISHVTFCYAEPTEELIIAVKSYFRGPNGNNYLVSAGTTAFGSEWCAWLGYNPYPGTAFFNMMSPYVKLGTVEVTDGDVKVTLDVDKNYVLVTTWVFIGTLEELTTTNLLEDGCPWFRNNEVWFQNDTPLTNDDGYSYMIFDF